MIVSVFSVLDTKAGAFGVPWFALNDNVAIRQFSDNAGDARQDNPWYRHPEDYTLYCVGQFNDATAELISAPPRALVTASALRSLNSEKALNLNGDNMAPVN